MAKPPQDSLLAASRSERAFSIPKNLMMAGAVVLIVIVVMVFSFKEAFSPPAQESEAENAKPKTVSPTPAGTEVLDALLKDQEAKGAEIAKKQASADGVASPLPTPINGAGFPEVGSNGNVNLPPAGKPASGENGQANDQAARELMIRESKIMGFDDSGNDAAGKLKQAMEPQSENANANQLDPQAFIKDTLKTSLAAANPASAQKTSRAQAEKDWRNENAMLTEGHEPLRGYTPASRFVLMQGKVINAVLKTSVNTDLPGEVQASVLMDVYDSISQKYLLIPKGSLLIGVYNSEVRIGQDRVNMAFKRLILPNGISVNLPGNLAMDSGGSSGIPGSVNNHYGRMFLVSTLTAIGAYQTSRNQSSGSGTVINTSPMQNGANQILSDMNKAVIDRNRALEPTITIPAGVRMLINVAQDIELPPYTKN